MADTLEDRVAMLRARGMTAIQIFEQFRKEGLPIPWVAVLTAFNKAGSASSAGG